jgi:hypothetical protein
MKTIDVTPTWSELLTVLLHLQEHGTTAEARATALGELRRMAKQADAHVAAMGQGRDGKMERDAYLPAMRMMETYGGGFASNLAKAALQADGSNWPRLAGTFRELFERYRAMADEEEGRCPHGMFRSGAGACPQCGGGAS